MKKKTIDDVISNNLKQFQLNVEKSINSYNRIIFSVQNQFLNLRLIQKFKDENYSISGHIISKERKDNNLKFIALNQYYVENQGDINEFLVNYLQDIGISANFEQSNVIDLYNGRKLATLGIETYFHTNEYIFEDSSEFRDLVREETDIALKSLAVIYGTMSYVFTNGISLDYKASSEKNPKIQKSSQFIKKYIDEKKTNEANLNFKKIIKSKKKIIILNNEIDSLQNQIVSENQRKN